METVFIRILNMSLAAAVVITAVLLVRLLLRRAPKKWSYLLWIAPAFRLCCPVSLKAAFSLFRLRPIAPAVQTLGAQTAAVAYVPQNIGTMAQPRLEIGTQRISETVSSVLPAPAPAASVNPLQIWLAVGAALWCAGMLAMLVYAAVSYVKTKRLLSDAVLLRDMVYETDRIRAPFLLGLFRPRIYVPAGLDEDTLRYVLAHERFHLRRGDHVVKALAFLLLTVHWFNPLCWLAFALMSRDMEMRCDESVLAAQGNCGKDYSRALLSFAAGRRFPAPSPLAFGETGVKARIRNALRWKKPRAWASILAAVLCLAVVAACAANPAEKADKLPGYKRDSAQPLETEQTLPAAAQTALDAFLQARKVEGSAKGDYAQKYERFELMRVLYQDEAQIFALLRDESKSNRPLAERPLLLLTLEKQSGAWQVADTPEWQGVENGLAAVEDRAAELFAQYSTPPARSEIDRALALLGDCEVLANCFPPAGSTVALWEGFFAAYPGQVELFYDESQTAELVSRAFFRSFGVENMDFASPTFVISLKKSCEIDDERFLSNIGFFFEENGDGDTIQIAVQVKPDGVYYMKADPWAVYAQNGWRVSDNLGAPVPASAEIPRGPAGLEIAARQGSIAAWLGSYSWDCDLGDGVRQGVEADAMHPLDPQAELPLLTVHPDTVSQSRPDYVTLLFDFEPDSLSVVCWDDARQPDASEPGERVTLEKQDGRFGFTLRSGSWVYMITASWRQAQYGGLAYYAFRGSSPTLTVDPALFGPVWTTVSCGGDDAVPLTVMRYARTWTGDGWLEADGIPIETTLAENVDSIPTLTWSEDFSVLFSPGIYRRTGIRIYNEDFQPRVLDRETPREWWEGDAGVHWLEPGSYYAVLGIYGPLGRYIEEEDKYEESGWDCVFRLVVPEGGPLAYTPGDAHDLVSARIGSVTLTDAPSLRTLERWLSGAELLPGGAKCPFSSMLWLTRADGTVLSLCPAEDSCGTLFSAGAYYRYAADNEAFWALFGIERDEDGALMIP